ncbi:MAG TPA: hypothetical protein VGD46_19485 [Rhizobacter sp.]
MSEPLNPDFAKALPGGALDATTFQQMEDALDAAGAPAVGEDGRWLTLPQRLQALQLAQADVLQATRLELKAMTERKDGAYEERNRVVAALASAFPSGIARTAIEGWSDDWHGCVYIDLPTGQASWHYHDSQHWLFAHLPPYTGTWDGHTTDEKYARLTQLREPREPALQLIANEHSPHWLRGCHTVLYQVLAERRRQELRWGEQNHPDFALQPLGRSRQMLIPTLIQGEYGICSARRAKDRCEYAHRHGFGSYGHILIEEVAEACEETDNQAKLRTELVQVAAVAVGWVEKIDRDLRARPHVVNVGATSVGVTGGLLVYGKYRAEGPADDGETPITAWGETEYEARNEWRMAYLDYADPGTVDDHAPLMEVRE